jgi:hypothetical protein
MSQRVKYLTGILAIAVYLAGASVSAVAQATRPDFQSPTGWYSYNRQFIAPPSGPGPVVQDPTRPYVSNDEFRVTGRQPTEQVADLNNPILQLWAREVIRKQNEVALAGKQVITPNARCWPIGVPGFILRPMTQAMYFVQAPTKVLMLLASKQEVRHIYLTDQHSRNVMPSWYGESRIYRPL